MKLRKRRILLLRERRTGMNAAGAAGSRSRISGVALGIHALVVAFAVVGCRASGGAPGNPIGIMAQWFSVLDGDDIRDSCRPGSGDRYRLIYNGRFQEQIRVYDVTAYGPQEAILAARAVRPGLNFSSPQGFDPGWQTSRTPLAPAEFAEFRQRLEDSGFYDPTPVGLELFSTDFYWVGISCENGKFHYMAYARPSPRFEALTFPKFLFDHDETGLAVNPPRNIPASERLRAQSGGIGRAYDDTSPRFRFVVDKTGIKGNYGLL
jgi:hypothetical protein